MGLHSEVPSVLPPSATQPSASDPTTAGAVASSNDASSATKVQSLQELKEKAPKVYKAILQGIAVNICNKMKDSEDRLKKLKESYNR